MIETTDLARDRSDGYGYRGCMAAQTSRNELVERYTPLVYYVVGRLRISVPGLFDHDDARQAGMVGLLRAIDGYDPAAEASFETYAILRIRGAIIDAVRAFDKTTRTNRAAARSIHAATYNLEHELGRSPTEAEVAARLDMPVARYRKQVQAISIVTMSLNDSDATADEDGPGSWADNMADPNAVDPAEEVSRRDDIARLGHEMDLLRDRTRVVLALHYHDRLTLREIGQVLGITESRVCQIHEGALGDLRNRLLRANTGGQMAPRPARLRSARPRLPALATSLP